MYQWHWSIIWHSKEVFLSGALTTLWLTLLTVLLGTTLGALLAAGKRSEDLVFSKMSSLIIESFRALPILVVLIWIYYVVPDLFGWRLSPFISALAALSLHLGAFAAETIRSGIESIPRSQLESGLALGMSEAQTMRRVILPQALRVMTPNLLGLYVNELKNSSLASIIAVNELLHLSNTLISQTYRPLEIYSAVALVYVVMILPLIALARVLEKRMAAGIPSSFNLRA